MVFLAAVAAVAVVVRAGRTVLFLCDCVVGGTEMKLP